jgi:hypothetical protein
MENTYIIPAFYERISAFSIGFRRNAASGVLAEWAAGHGVSLWDKASESNVLIK